MESAASALKRLMPELVVSKQKLRQAEGSCSVRWKREEGKQNVGFSSRPFVLCGLPVRKPRSGEMLYERRNGNFALQITGHPHYGLPFGQDRIVPIYLYRRLIAAFERIFGATIFFGTDGFSGKAKVVQRSRFSFFSEAQIWYSRDPNQCPLSDQLHRIGDPRVVRLIRKRLKAGVMEQGEWKAVDEGTPQGGVISPLLSNVFLHYVFDLWINHWRKTQSVSGDVIVVRWADDFVIGFQNRAAAERCLAELKKRFEKFGLVLHPEKTRLIQFGPYAAADRIRRGQGRPETFDFLGFTHICGKKRGNGMYTVVRRTAKKRMSRKLQEVKAELRRRMHEPIARQGKWLGSVVGGFIRYHGVPTNAKALQRFRFQIGGYWHHALRMRGSRRRVTWERMYRLIDRWLPPATVCHPYPLKRMGVIT